MAASGNTHPASTAARRALPAAAVALTLTHMALAPVATVSAAASLPGAAPPPPAMAHATADVHRLPASPPLAWVGTGAPSGPRLHLPVPPRVPGSPAVELPIAGVPSPDQRIGLIVRPPAPTVPNGGTVALVDSSTADPTAVPITPAVSPVAAVPTLGAVPPPFAPLAAEPPTVAPDPVPPVTFGAPLAFAPPASIAQVPEPSVLAMAVMVPLLRRRCRRLRESSARAVVAAGRCGYDPRPVRVDLTD